MAEKSNNTLVAKNAIFLYLRMILVMLVNLFAVRVVLQTLGIVDYGIYNLVGGIVVMFSFLSQSMASAAQRFFSIELGKKDNAQLKKVFSATFVLYLFVILIIVIFAETVGLWFINNQLDKIPQDRLTAVNYVYQFSIMTLVMTMVTIPYNAVIIAHEKMSVYAYVSLLEVVLKLAIVYVLLIFSYDKLILYSFLTFLVTALISSIYRIYCKRSFSECRVSFTWDRKLFKHIAGYSGWNLFDAMSSVVNAQGINILLGVFFGPTVNAARAIAYQVSVTMNQFVLNFLTATRPQIMKYYIAGEKSKMNNLVFKASKFSFFLLFIVALPILLKTDFVFTLWLKTVPDYVVLFTRVIIIAILIDVVSYPLTTAVQANGNLKRYNLIIGGCRLAAIPLTIIIYYMGGPAVAAFVVNIVVTILCLIIRLVLLRKIVDFPVTDFLNKVIWPLLFTALSIYGFCYMLLQFGREGFYWNIVEVVTVLCCTAVAILFIGISKNERNFLLNLIGGKFLKRVKPACR